MSSPMCPFLREIVMAYCSAYPVRKLVPKDRMTEKCACTCDDFNACTLFSELMARLRTAPEAGAGDLETKEDPQ
jgi:hypothetical protein